MKVTTDSEEFLEGLNEHMWALVQAKTIVADHHAAVLATGSAHAARAMGSPHRGPKAGPRVPQQGEPEQRHPIAISSSYTSFFFMSTQFT